MSVNQSRTHKVRFRSATRENADAQLRKAPESLLGKIMLEVDVHNSGITLTIPSDGNAPACAAWVGGTEKHFEVLVFAHWCCPTNGAVLELLSIWDAFQDT